MKRMLVFAIALMLLTAALSGCAELQETSAPTNGAKNSMLMTIAETSDSCGCAAFEYREAGQPYCFYAYDLEGKFYRVLWDMPWEDLHEKDLIAVDYTGEIREIDEWKLDGGYTPQYEITATFVHPEREVLASCLTHGSDGDYTLTLPQSGKTLKLSEEQERFLPYITDELVAEAESRLTQEASGFVNHSGFFLQIQENHLCLVFEAIRQIDDPEAFEEDHEHLFYAERISDRAVKAEAVPHDPFAKSTVLYRAGGAEITAYRSLLWSLQENADGSFTQTETDRYATADVLSGRTPVSIEEEIPTLLSDGAVTALLPVNCEIEHVTLFTAEGDGFSASGTTLEALADLAPGVYYVAVYVWFSGNCAPDALQVSARYEDLFRLEVREPPHSGYETTVELLQYSWDGYGIGRKTLSNTDLGYAIMYALQAMEETGETAPKLSDAVLIKTGDGLSGEFPVPRGTMWIEAGGMIYRLTPDLSQICRVKTHFGEGQVLEMSEAFKTDVSNAWNYAPFDYYKGTYHSGDDTVELTNVFAASSSVELRIKEIQIEKNEDPHNRITVELLSETDQTAAIKLHCQQSDDNHALGDGKTVELREGVAETVELTFGGWENVRYWVYIMADNTMVELLIEP